MSFDSDQPEGDGNCFMDDPHNVQGYDLSGEEYADLFADHKRIHDLTPYFEEQKERLNKHLDESGHKDDIEQRMQLRKMLAVMKLMAQTAQLKDERAELGEDGYAQKAQEMFRKADPLAIEELLRLTTMQYDNLFQQTQMGLAVLSHLYGPEDAKKTLQPLFVESLRIFQKLQIALGEQALRNMDSIARGAPDWNDETGTEVEGSTPYTMAVIPSFVDGSLPEGFTPPQPAPTPESEIALLDRLLSGLNLG